jgi:hypothetical protein
LETQIIQNLYAVLQDMCDQSHLFPEHVVPKGNEKQTKAPNWAFPNLAFCDLNSRKNTGNNYSTVLVVKIQSVDTPTTKKSSRWCNLLILSNNKPRN